MKRLCAAVIVTVSLCLFVLLVTREPASTATRSQVPRDEQPGAMSPMLDSERHSNESTDPTSSSDWTTASSTTEPTSTTLYRDGIYVGNVNAADQYHDDV